jgi:hypothetical protein
MIGALIGDYCGSRWEKKSPPTTTEFDLDHILEKIELSGIESLSDEEKKFLDNFEN